MVAHVTDKAFGLYEAFVINADQTLRDARNFRRSRVVFFASPALVNILLLIACPALHVCDLLWVRAGGETHTYITNITAV